MSDPALQPTCVETPSVPILDSPPRLNAIEWITFGTLIAAPLLLIILWYRDVIRPGSPARAGIREVKSNGFVVWIVAAFTTFAAQAFGGMTTAAVLIDRTAPRSLSDLPVKEQAIIGLGGFLPAILAGIVLVKLLRERGDAAKCGLKAGWGDIPRGLLSFLATYPVVAGTSQAAVVVYEWLTEKSADRIAHSALQTIINQVSDPWAWVLAGGAVIGAPIVEELIFRVFIQSAILRLTARPWAAIVLTSLIFTSVHISVMPVYGLVSIFVLAMGMGIAYERSKRIGVPIVIHVMFNLVNVVMAITMA